MDVHIYTRGSGRFDDHQFVGPEMEFWWRESIGYWVQAGRPAVLARRRGNSFEVVLCGLPTSRNVEATPIATMAFLVAPTGSDDAAMAAGLAAAWLSAIHRGEVDKFEPAVVIDGLLDESFINESLGEQGEPVALRMTEIADRLREKFRGEVNVEIEPIQGSFVGALDSVDGRELADNFLQVMAMAQHGSSETDDGRMIVAFLNMAADQTDAEQAFAHQEAQAVLLIPGHQPREPRQLSSPKAPAVGRSPRPAARSEMSTILVSSILVALILAAFIAILLMTQ